MSETTRTTLSATCRDCGGAYLLMPVEGAGIDGAYVIGGHDIPRRWRRRERCYHSGNITYRPAEPAQESTARPPDPKALP